MPFLFDNHFTSFFSQKDTGQKPADKISMNIAKLITPRNVFFLFFSAVISIIFFTPIRELFVLSQDNELYSHIFFIPIVSAYIIYQRKTEIFSGCRFSFGPGIVFLIAGIIMYLFGRTQGLQFDQNDYLSIMMFSALLSWLGIFVIFFGIKAFQKAVFPLLFLVLIVPIPLFAVNKIIFILQSASAEVSYAFLKATGVPIYREGFVFQLPNISVEVAEECSGIRSSIALFITSVLAGHFFLRNGWSKIFLILIIFPITVFKNGLRITSLSLLGAYVDIGYLTDSVLHRNGGMLFFILGLLLLGPILVLLKKTEGRHPESRQEGVG